MLLCNLRFISINRQTDRQKEGGTLKNAVGVGCNEKHFIYCYIAGKDQIYYPATFQAVPARPSGIAKTKSTTHDRSVI